MASASLVGQALGKEDPDGAYQWAWDVTKLAAVTVATISTVGLVAPDMLLGFFLHDPEILALARTPLRLLAATMVFDTVGLILMNSLLGAGDNRRVMVVSISLQWLVFLPVAWVIGPGLGYGLTAVWLAQVVYRAIQSLVFVTLWKGKRWAEVQV
jgi:Na+-driven multidrug efflux pump